MNTKEKLNKESSMFGRLDGVFKTFDKDHLLQAHDYMIIESPNFRGKILDVGAGPCILPIVAKLKDPQLTISAMDGSKLSTEIGKILVAKHKLNIDIVHTTIEDHPYKNGWFDTIVLNHIIEHIKDLDMVFSQCEKMLKPEGTILIAVPYQNAHYSPNHVHFFDINDKYPKTTNIVKFFKKRGYKADINIFDEEKIDERHPYKSRGQLDMYIEVKNVN